MKVKILSFSEVETILQNIIHARKHGGIGITRDEGEAMAKMLLAALNQEPVAWMVGTTICENLNQALANKADSDRPLKPLFLAPGCFKDES